MPTISVDVDVDLDDFDTNELIEELESRGRMSDFHPPIDLTRIEHLIVCGQIEQAKAESWAMITKALEEAV